MQAAGPAAAKRRLRYRAGLLVQGIDAAPAAEQTEAGFDAGRVATRVQADCQSAVIVGAKSFRQHQAITAVMTVRVLRLLHRQAPSQFSC